MQLHTQKLQFIPRLEVNLLQLHTQYGCKRCSIILTISKIGVEKIAYCYQIE